MTLSWNHESPARWDPDKQRIVGDAEAGIFQIKPPSTGALVAGEWWRVQRGEEVVGYGWMDIVWGEGEILLAVDQRFRGAGIGSFIIENLSKEAASRGLRMVHNQVRASHPDAAVVTAWLCARGFQHDADSERLFRKT